MQGKDNSGFIQRCYKPKIGLNYEATFFRQDRLDRGRCQERGARREGEEVNLK